MLDREGHHFSSSSFYRIIFYAPIFCSIIQFLDFQHLGKMIEELVRWRFNKMIIRPMTATYKVVFCYSPDIFFKYSDTHIFCCTKYLNGFFLTGKNPSGIFRTLTLFMSKW